MQISIYQERFLLEWLLNPQSSKYNVSLLYKLDKTVNLEYLEKACEYALDDENFHIAFTKDNKPYKADYSLNDFITYIKYDDAKVKEYLVELINKPFDIYDGPLYKYYIITTNSNIYLLSVAYHILADAITANTLNRRLENFYNHLSDKNSHIDLSKESFSEAVELEHSLITKEKKESAKEYWLEFLKNYPLNVDFPVSSYTNTSSKSEVLYLEIQGDEYSRLKKAVKKSRTTLFQYVTAVYSLVISKITNQEEIILSYPINLRPKSHTKVTGSFVNNVLLKADVKGDISFNDLIISLNKQRKSSKEHLWYSLSDIVKNLREERSKDIGDNFFNISIGEAVFSGSTINLSGVHTEGMMDVSWSKESDALLSLQFDATSDREKITFQLEYQCEKVDPLLMKKFLNHFKNTLNDIAYTPEIQMSHITLLDKEEYQKLVYTNNQTDKEYPHSTIHEIFTNQAKLTPDNIALVYEDKELTYKELDSLSNSLAREIKQRYKLQASKELQADTPIGLCLERSQETIISILAILKSGAAYVPIDPNYPDERITYILEDTASALVLTQSHLIDKLEAVVLGHESIKDNISLLAVDKYEYKTQDDSELPSIFTPESLAYVIYTSGTTGKPKGVMIEHKAFADFIMNFPLDKDKINWLSLTSFTFDIFGLEYAFPLLNGGKMVLSKVDRVNIDVNPQNDINIIQQTPSVLQLMMNGLNNTSLKEITCLVGGEALSKDILTKLQNLFKRVFNVYGPSETVIWSSIYECTHTQNSAIIGKPLANERLYILNESLIPVPEGVTGELYIAGAGVARGYLNREDLTKERFLPNPFARRKDGRDDSYKTMYKTGDLVKLVEDNNIEYIGRNDFQVKIRGYRIELPEIESIIFNYEGVKQAVVQAKEHNGSKYLVAYYTTTKSVNEKELTNFLTKELPEYMVPSAFIEVDEFKLTTNGKLNTKALPEPEFKSEEYEAPTTELQEKLCDVFQEVLKCERVGISDDFFKIGGNSILAISLAHKLSQALSLEIKVADIFTFKTIEHLVKNGLHHDEVHIPVTNRDKTPLSFAQQRLYFIEKYEDGTNAYNIPMTLELLNTTDLEFFKQAIQAVVNRQDILRTVIKEDNDSSIYQEISTDELIFHEYILDSEEMLDDKLKEDSNRIFNLNDELPIYVSIYKVDESIYMLINIHHIAFDGWSTKIFFKELYQYYYHYKDNTTLDLPILTINYKDFALWQREYLQEKEQELQYIYWEEKLKDIEPLTLSTDYQRPKTISYDGDNYYLTLDDKLSEELSDLAKDRGVTPYTLLLCVFNVLLSKYSNQEDITVGSPTASRHFNQVEELVGLFVNTLAIRNQVSSDESFSSLLEQVEMSVIQAQSHQDIPFEHLVDRLNIERDTSRNPLFDIMFTFQNFVPRASNKDKLFSIYDLDSYNVAKFDLELSVVQDDTHSLHLLFNYATSLFKPSTIETMASQFVRILEQIVFNPYIHISDISLLDKNEYKQLAYINNQTEKEYPQSTIHELFTFQAKQTPDNTALIYEDRSLTYKELDSLTNSLAREIQERYKLQTSKTLQADTLIALCLDRSLDMIVAIIATLKAGAAYVPIDPSYPDERITYILEDSASVLLLTQSHLKDKLNALVLEHESIKDNLSLVAVDEYDYKTQSSSYLPSITTPRSLAYVIYTSGTTGKPKGVMVEHRGVVNLVENQLKEFDITDKDRILQFASYSFDAATLEIYTALIYGAILVIASSNQRENISELVELIEKQEISFALLPPVYLKSIEYRTLPMLKTLLVGGEACSKDVMDVWSKGRTFVNAYGPTESTVYATLHKYETGSLHTNIGLPINNTKLYVLDTNLNLVPRGVTGELYIAGAGVARGYLNQEELTKERFLPNPFARRIKDRDKDNSIMYKTGDLVRLLEDNSIEYIGRNDFQVKIRGYRIELPEIESIISSYDGVKQAVVLAKEHNGNKFLVAYYTTTQSVNEKELTNHLTKELPEYMVPSRFIKVDEFKLTVNGKLNTNALPEPEFKSEEYDAPITELQEKLCDVFQKVLKVKRVGINDDFFKIGGDSILSIQLSSRLRKSGLECSVKDIFNSKTVQKLSKYLEENHTKTIINAEQEVLEGAFELLPVQKWFFEKIESGELPNYNHWNQSFMIKVPELDVKQLDSTLHKLSQHHDMLRVTYTKVVNEDGTVSYTQSYNKNIKVPNLETLDVSTYNEEELSSMLTRYQSEFDIYNDENKPLWTIKYLYNYSDRSARIFFSAHHLIIDAVSWRILLEDIYTLYHNENLLSKSSSYREWIKSVKKYAGENESELEYWKTNTGSHSKYTNLKESSSKEISFSKEVTNDLLQRSNQAYNTEINDVLLCALSYALSSITKDSKNYITLEGHGREDIYSNMDTTRAVGWFTTVYPFKLEKKENIALSLKTIKESLRSIPNKGIGYGALKYYSSNTTLAKETLPPVGFNYLGVFESSSNNNDEWNFADESSGIAMKDEDNNSINMNGFVVDERLRFNISSKLSHEELELFSNTFENSLKEIVSHCVDQIDNNMQNHTPSDFNVPISIELFDSLYSDKIEAIYKANSLQQDFINHHLAYPEDNAYRIQQLIDYNNPINVDLYKRSWELLIETYPMLRTSFNWQEEAIQIVHKEGVLDFNFYDFSDSLNIDEDIKTLQENDRAISFDLSKPTLMRIYLIKQNESKYTLLKSDHHSISGGLSGSILLEKLHEYYELLKNKTDVVITKDKVYQDIKIYDTPHYKLIEPYNSNYNETLPKLIFIHPSQAGTEVYQNLADKLAQEYICIGIDNHNINSSEKIDSTKLIATYYLNEYKKQYKLSENITLCAWSLGGKIALEMVYLLEKEGYRDINLVLLDTILLDEDLRLLFDKLHSSNNYKNRQKESMYKNYGEEYADKVVSAIDAEKSLLYDTLSGKLEYASVTLLKAMQVNTIADNEEHTNISKYTVSLNSNNIEYYADKITIHELDCHHYNILDNLDISEYLRV